MWQPAISPSHVFNFSSFEVLIDGYYEVVCTASKAAGCLQLEKIQLWREPISHLMWLLIHFRVVFLQAELAWKPPRIQSLLICSHIIHELFCDWGTGDAQERHSTSHPRAFRLWGEGRNLQLDSEPGAEEAGEWMDVYRTLKLRGAQPAREGRLAQSGHVDKRG